jgi:hypothetical protein
MDEATTAIVHGVMLETIGIPDSPDTVSLLAELGSVYPLRAYPVEPSEAAEDPLAEPALSQ